MPGSEVDFIGCFDFIDGPVYRENKLCDKIDYCYDSNNVYFRLHMNPSFKEADLSRPRISHFLIYLKKKNAVKKSSNLRIAVKHGAIFPLLKKKYNHELMLTFVGKMMYQPTLSTALADNLWETRDFQNINMPINEIVDISIPFDDLGIKSGQKLEVLFVAGCNSVCRAFMPKDSLLEIVRPK